jgi:hypothetical protein
MSTLLAAAVKLLLRGWSLRDRPPVENFTREIQPAKVPPLFGRIGVKTRRRDLMYCRCVRYSLLSPAILCCFIVMFQGYIPGRSYAAGDGIRTMSGIVDEVLSNESPPVIMVRSKPGMKDEVVIGAVVRKGASILRGKKPIALHHIRAGERVTLTYMKQRDGLTVRSIVVHPR